MTDDVATPTDPGLPSPRRPGLLPLVAAAALPALVVATWALTLGAPEPEGALSDAAAAMEADLETTDPDVVVLGNSGSYRGLDLDVLGARLGRPGKVSRLWVPDSFPATWYAVLKNRVIAGGHDPDLVVAMGTIHHLLDTSNDKPSRRARLREQMGPDDALLEERVFGQDVALLPFLERIRTRTQGWIDVPKYLAVDWLVGGGEGEDALSRGAAVADPALSRVFDIESGLDADLGGAALPFGAQGGEARVTGADDGATFDAEASFILDLADLANAHDQRLVVVRFPWPKGVDPPSLPPRAERRMIEGLNARGVGYVDLSDADIPDTAFFDATHMNAAGRAAFTPMLAEALIALDALGDTPFPPAPLPLSLGTPTLQGTPAPLPVPTPTLVSEPCTYLLPLPGLAAVSDKALYDEHQFHNASPVVLTRDGEPLAAHSRGQACDGGYSHAPDGLMYRPASGSLDAADLALSFDAEAFAATLKRGPRAYDSVAWVYPGTTLTLPSDEAWSADRSPFRVVVEAVGTEAPGQATLSAGDLSAPVVIEQGEAEVVLDGPAPDGPWTLRLASPDDGPVLLVRRLVVGADDDAIAVYGAPPRAGGKVVRFVGHTDLTDTFDARFAAPPPALGVTPKVSPPAPGDRSAAGLPLARIAMRELQFLSEPAVRRKSAQPWCSPVRLLEDGVPLAGPNSEPGQVLEQGRGAYHFQGVAALATASDNSDPLTNGRTYTARLAANRTCRRALWIYPGDDVRIVPKTLDQLSTDARTLQLGLSVLGPDDATGPLRVQVVSDAMVHLDTTLSHDTYATGSVRLPLDVSLPPDAPNPRIRLVGEDTTPFLFMTVAAFAEQGPDSVQDAGAELEALSALLTPSSAERTGPAALPALPPPEDLGGGCQFLYALPELAPISNLSLFQDHDLKWASPVRVLEDGQPLTPHETTLGCVGGFTHGPKGVVVKPASGSPQGHRYTLAWAEPEQTLDRRGADPITVWWAAPGTTTTLSFDGPWSEDAPFDVFLDALPLGDAPIQGTLTAGDTSAPLDDTLALRGVTADGPWSLDLTLPPTAAPLMIRRLAPTPVAQAPRTPTPGMATAPSPGQAAAGGRLSGTPQLGAVPAPRALGPCKALIALPQHEALSDLALHRDLGLTYGSPLVVREDGVPMGPHDKPSGCDGGYTHAPNGLILRPRSGSPDGHTYTVGFPDAPAVTITQKGEPDWTGWWVAPGATLHLDYPAGAAKGEVVVEAYLRGGGMPAIDLSGTPGRWSPAGNRHRATFPAPGPGPFTLRLAPGDDGPAVLLREVRSGDRVLTPKATGSAPSPTPAAPAAAPAPDAPAEAPAAPAPGGAAGRHVFPLAGIGKPWKDPSLLEAFQSRKAQADITVSALSGGRTGLKVDVTTPEVVRVCTAYVDASSDLSVTTELKLTGLVPGPKPWHTLLIEDRWKDDAQDNIEVDGRLFQHPVSVEADTDWTTKTLSFEAPPQGASVSLCYRFARSKGVLEVSRLELTR